MIDFLKDVGGSVCKQGCRLHTGDDMYNLLSSSAVKILIFNLTVIKVSETSLILYVQHWVHMRSTRGVD